MEEVKVQVKRSDTGFILIKPTGEILTEDGPTGTNIELHKAVGEIFIEETYQELKKMEIGKAKTFTFTLS